MTNFERSTFIFKLASELGISLRDDEVFEDAQLMEFARLYLERARQRDDALRQHLQNVPTAFRCFLPYSDTVFGVAF